MTYNKLSYNLFIHIVIFYMSAKSFEIIIRASAISALEESKGR